jgi:hypothetical protein
VQVVYRFLGLHSEFLRVFFERGGGLAPFLDRGRSGAVLSPTRVVAEPRCAKRGTRASMGQEPEERGKDRAIDPSGKNASA